MRQKFKLFGVFGPALDAMERDMNTWAEKLPAGTKIRRTQLAAGNAGDDTSFTPTGTDKYIRSPGFVVALVNYEEEEPLTPMHLPTPAPTRNSR